VKTILATLAVVAALAAPAALAANEPAAYGSATSGALSVTSGVLLGPKTADMRGVWLDETRPCSETRALKVTVEVFFSSSTGATRRKVLSKTGPVGNCAEGGPNFGFTFRAKKHGFACASGAWKPGSYSFATTTRDTTTGLVGTASLNWVKTAAC
jgi:hypothetical protein